MGSAEAQPGDGARIGEGAAWLRVRGPYGDDRSALGPCAPADAGTMVLVVHGDAPGPVECCYGPAFTPDPRSGLVEVRWVLRGREPEILLRSASGWFVATGLELPASSRRPSSAATRFPPDYPPETTVELAPATSWTGSGVSAALLPYASEVEELRMMNARIGTVVASAGRILCAAGPSRRPACANVTAVAPTAATLTSASAAPDPLARLRAMPAIPAGWRITSAADHAVMLSAPWRRGASERAERRELLLRFP